MLSLIPAIVDAVQAPVIAAGGIADARQVAAAFALGADAVQIGTAFLATRQSAAAPEHRRALAHGDRHTRLTSAFTGRLARALATELAIDEIAPFPYQAWLMRPLLRAHWAGQSARLVRPDRDAVELLEELAAGC